jgi:hypothetical protein
MKGQRERSTSEQDRHPPTAPRAVSNVSRSVTRAGLQARSYHSPPPLATTTRHHHSPPQPNTHTSDARKHTHTGPQTHATEEGGPTSMCESAASHIVVVMLASTVPPILRTLGRREDGQVPRARARFATYLIDCGVGTCCVSGTLAPEWPVGRGRSWICLGPVAHCLTLWEGGGSRLSCP